MNKKKMLSAMLICLSVATSILFSSCSFFPDSNGNSSTSGNVSDVGGTGSGNNGNSGGNSAGGGFDGEEDIVDPETEGILRTQGELIVNEKGEEIFLCGINAGGLFVTENWMNGFSDAASDDYHTATNVLVERFGKEKTKELWAAYEANWWSDIDFQNCVDMGMKAIRLPFTYMNVDFDAAINLDDGGKNYDFSKLDAFVKKAADYGLYTILDLHGAYGSHNGQDHSGEVLSSASQVDFYRNEQKMALTEKLWVELAKHYKDNPAVAAFDLLNEPGEKGNLTNQVHWDYFDRLYDAIREVDNQHIIVIESCWAGTDLPHPSVYGWENVMYSFHHYTGADNNYDLHVNSYNMRIEDITSQNFGVPMQMGEFTGYVNANSWEYTLQLLNDNHISWFPWTYKLNPSTLNSWGVYNKLTTEVNKVNVKNDSYETILAKFALLKTDSTTIEYSFGDKTLKSILTKYYTGKPEPVIPPLEKTETGITLENRDGKAYVAISGTFDPAMPASEFEEKYKQQFYADWRNNKDYSPSNKDWGDATLYSLDGAAGTDKAILEVTEGNFKLLLDISKHQADNAIFFHYGDAKKDLTHPDATGELTIGNMKYEMFICEDWESKAMTVLITDLTAPVYTPSKAVLSGDENGLFVTVDGTSANYTKEELLRIFKGADADLQGNKNITNDNWDYTDVTVQSLTVNDDGTWQVVLDVSAALNTKKDYAYTVHWNGDIYLEAPYVEGSVTVGNCTYSIAPYEGWNSHLLTLYIEKA